MKAYHLSTLVKLAFLLAIGARTTMHLVSSYTFDPLNNSWKPSTRRKKQTRNHRPDSSFSENSYAPPKSRPSPGVQFTYDEEDIVRHHYTAFGVGANGEQQTNDPAFVPKASLVEIQYNKKTGEVSLLDEAGVVTPEQYKRIVKAVKYANEEGADGSNGNTAFEQELKSQQREEGVAVGTTLYIDPEDLDPTEIIDVKDGSSDSSSPRQETPIPEYEQRLKDHPQPQLQDNSQPTIEYHQSEFVSPSETSRSTTTGHATQTAHASHAETFETYSIPQPHTQTDPSQPTASAAGYTNVQQPQQHQDYQYAQHHVQTAAAVATEPTAHGYQYAQHHVQTAAAVATEPTAHGYQYAQQHVQTATAVATEPTAHGYQYAQQHVQTATAVATEPTAHGYQYAQQQVQTATAVATEPTAHGYQYAQQHVQTTTAVPTEPTVEQYYQQQNQQRAGYSYDYQGYYEPTMVTEQLNNEQGAEEIYYDDGTYRKSRGFGFAHRRESFTGTAYEY